VESNLKVTPAELQRTATAFGMHGKTIATTTDNMMTLVNNLTARWEGDTYMAYRKTFGSLQDDILKINNKIQEHVLALNEIAENYIQPEDETMKKICKNHIK